jgi:hypothetical protein
MEPQYYYHIHKSRPMALYSVTESIQVEVLVHFLHGSCSTKPLAGVQLLDVQRLLVQYIRSYHSYLEVVSIRNLRADHDAVPK